MRSRLLYMIGLAAVAVPLAAASVAYACTSLATISLSPGSGPAGTTVTVKGKGFAPHDRTDDRAGELAYVRFDSQRGPVLAEVAPKGNSGSFTVEIQIPQSADPGNHVILATQNRTNGSPAGGTPARQAFAVTTPAQAEAPPAAVTPSRPGRPGRQAQAPARQDAPAAATPSQPATSTASGRAAASSEPARPTAPRGGVSGAVDAPGSSPTAAGAAPANLGPPGGTGTAPGAAPAAGAAADRAGAPGSVAATADRRFGAPSPAPVGGPRSMMSPAGPSTLLAMLLVGFGLLLTLGGGALVAAHRRGVDVPALARSFLRR